MQEILGCIVEIAKRNTLHTFTVSLFKFEVHRRIKKRIGRR
ncbi:hypothetical protein [Candidatus Rhabdochlamydia oedothoracis]